MPAAASATVTPAVTKVKSNFNWRTVVNNNELMQALDIRRITSYKQPSVNLDGLQVVPTRRRSGPPLRPPAHGICVRGTPVADSET